MLANSNICPLLQVRPTPAHLTSVQAEHILAQACENESLNAKRMRLGLDPVSQPLPTVLPTPMVSNTFHSLQLVLFVAPFSEKLTVFKRLPSPAVVGNIRVIVFTFTGFIERP